MLHGQVAHVHLNRFNRGAEQPPDFDRDVHCVFGLPFDALSEDAAVQRVRTAAKNGQRLFLSTPNLNFAVACLQDTSFRRSVVVSDLSTADGAPIVWLSRLMGLPLRERVPGAGLFDRLAENAGDHRVGVYFFGGPQGSAERAHQRLNVESDRPGVRSVGWQSPGFGKLEDMSGAGFTDPINACGAEFVVVALGAKKGQAWIERNWPALDAPVIGHLGAVVNFVAGTVNRSPRWLQRTGMEWLWRIKEEPSLWRRYWNDGWRFLHYLVTGALPLALFNRPPALGAEPLRCEPSAEVPGVLRLSGDAANGSALAPLRDALRAACSRGETVVLDMAGVTRVDSGFIALVQLLEGWHARRGRGPVLRSVPPAVARTLRWAGVSYLLERTPRAVDEAASHAMGVAEPRQAKPLI